MASPSLFISLAIIFFSFFSFFSFINPAMGDGGTEDLIETVCRQTEDYGFCKTVFNLHPPQPNVYGLIQLTMLEAKYNASNTYEFIQGLLANTTDKTMKNYLTVCSNAYDLVAKSFGQAFDAYAKGDYRGMYQYERGTARAAASCATIFETPPIPKQPSPLNERNRTMRILISMAVITAYQLVR